MRARSLGKIFFHGLWFLGEFVFTIIISTDSNSTEAEMNKDNLLKLMDNIPFFKEMDNAEREILLAHEKHWMQFKPQEKILKEDEVDYGFFVLLEGKVSVLRSKPTEMTLAQLVPGALFGEITMKTQRPRTSSIKTDEEVTVFKVDALLIDKLSHGLIIKIKDQIINLVITRLDEVNYRLDEVSNRLDEVRNR